MVVYRATDAFGAGLSFGLAARLIEPASKNFQPIPYSFEHLQYFEYEP